MINLYKVLFYLEFSGLITVVEANSLRENQQIRNRPVWRNYLRLQKKKKKVYLKSPIGKKSMFDPLLKEGDDPCTKHKPNDATASSTRWQK